jgi:hypothetical protein
MTVRLVLPSAWPGLAADQQKDLLDDRNTDLSRLAADVKTCMIRHGKAKTFDAFLKAYIAADRKGAKR